MPDLLTLNGVPPQKILTPAMAQQQAIGELTAPKDCYVSSQKNYAAQLAATPLEPLTTAYANTVRQYTAWGATICGTNMFEFIAQGLLKGQNIYTNLQMHSDGEQALRRMWDENILVLRAYYTTSIPVDIVDLTGKANIAEICQQHLDYTKEGSDFYRPELLEWAKATGNVLQPQVGELWLYDGNTPHLPKAAIAPHRRGLAMGWTALKLPSDWQQRLKMGNVPRLNLI